MRSLSHALLVGLGLSVPALGGILPTLKPASARTDPTVTNHPCQHGERTCDRNYIYFCNVRGRWTVESFCIYPSWCNENEATGDAWCEENASMTPAPPVVELKKKGGIVTPDSVASSLAPTPAPTLTPTRTYKPGLTKNGANEKKNVLASQTRCMEGDLRCNRGWEEACDAFGKWQQFQQCDSCIYSDDGTVNCAPATATSTAPVPPPTPHTGDLRCNGNTEEIYNEVSESWEPSQECIECIDNNDGTVNCAPASALPPQPTAPPQCNEGDRHCDDNWLEICNAQRLWDRIQKCSSCVNGEDDTYCAPLETSTASAFSISTQPPTAAPTFGVALDNPCFGGEVKCNGDRISVCSAEREWEDYGPCPNCKQLYNTRVNCDYDDAAQAQSMAALLARATALPTTPIENCPERGFERCASDNKTVEICGSDGHWNLEEQCTSMDTCLGIAKGIAFCVDAKIAEEEVARYRRI